MNPTRWRDVSRRLLLQNFFLKLVALALTLALFVWVREQRSSTVTVALPLQLVPPRETVLARPPVEDVRVTLRGAWPDIASLDVTQLAPLRVILDGTTRPSSLELKLEALDLPAGLRAVSIDPPRISYQLEPLVSRRVVIHPSIVGTPPPPLGVGQATVTPHHIDLWGPESVVKRTSAVVTEAIDVRERRESFSQNVRLNLEHPLLQHAETSVTVHVPIHSHESSRILERLPVHAVNTSRKVSIEPASTAVTLRGPRGVLETLTPGAILAVLDMGHEDRGPAGVFQKDVQIRNLPPQVTLQQVYPTSFKVQLQP